MVSPEFNGIPDPTFRIRTYTQPKTMTGILIPAIFDFYSGIS